MEIELAARQEQMKLKTEFELDAMDVPLDDLLALAGVVSTGVARPAVPVTGTGTPIATDVSPPAGKKTPANRKPLLYGRKPRIEIVFLWIFVTVPLLTDTTSSMIRESAALVMTTSFRTSSSAKTLPPRSVLAWSIIRSSIGAVPASTASSAMRLP